MHICSTDTSDLDTHVKPALDPESGSPRRPMVVGLSLEPEDIIPLHLYPFGGDDRVGGGDRAGEEDEAAETDERLLALARGLASSPAWAAMRDAIIVVRTDPPAGLAVLGNLTDEDVSRLQMLPGQLRQGLKRLRHVDYSTVEADCEALGEKLIGRFGRTAVSAMTFTSIPRGGLIVLGMLSYVLGLRREQLSMSRPGPGGRAVVVDDCALTGHRFGEYLQGHPALADGPVGSVIFAHLYSHPSLRRAIETREERVVAVLAAQDLHDHGPELMGNEYAAWRDRWMARANGRCYWVGRPDRISFPWSEPDLAVWNPRRQREEPGWRVAPPERCLKNRFGSEEGQERIQVQRTANGPVRPARRTFFGTLGDAVVVANLESREVVRLPGVAGEMWEHLMATGDPVKVASILGRQYDAAEAELREDVQDLIRDLGDRGILATDGSRSERTAGSRPAGGA